MNTSQPAGSITIIEGSIGVGKSTLVRSLASHATKHKKNQWCVVMLEEIVPSLLDLYINDMSRYAFPFQVIVARNRCELMRSAIAEARNGAVVFVDRGLPGDMAFAQMQHSQGKFLDSEYKVYLDMIADAHPDFVPFEIVPGTPLKESTITDVPVTVVYLESDPVVAFARMRKRANACEVTGYTLDYFRQLHDAYERIIERFEKSGNGSIRLERVDYNGNLQVDEDGILSEADCARAMEAAGLLVK